MLLVLCAVGMALFVALQDANTAFEQALVELARAVPGFFDIIWQVALGLATLWAGLLILAAVGRARWDVLRDHVLSLLLAAGLAEVLRQHGDQSASLRLALIVATTVVASPHIARPYRTTGRWLVGAAAASVILLAHSSPTGAVIGGLCGAAAASIVHLLFGSSAGRPSTDRVARGLDELGVEVRDLSEAERQPAGVFLLDAVDADGEPLVVKVYGRDAWDSQLLTKAWRALWYRDAEALTLTRAQQAEHEGFVTLMAGTNGVPTNEVVRAGRTGANDAIIVIRPRGRALDAEPTDLDDAVLMAMWDSVLALGAAGFSHGDLAPDRFRLEDGDGEAQVVLDGLGAATLATAGDQQRVDHAQVLASTAVLVGIERSVATALARLGPDDLAEVLPYLQTAALGPRLRSALGSSDVDLDDLRTAAAEAAGVDEPKLAQLRRVSRSTLIQAALMFAAGYILISSLAGVDLSQVADALREASLPILLVAMAFGQTPRFALAESTRAACPRPLAYGPVVLLQFAITFVNLVIPSTAARVAVNIRFFQKQGIPPASAVSIGVIDSFGGFLVQVAVISSVVLFGFGNIQFDLQSGTDGSSGGLLTLLLALLVLAVVAIVLALLVPKARHWVIEKVRPWWQEILDTLSSLRSPSKVARVLGANLASELLFASTLGIVLLAFGTSLPLSTLLVINVCVSLFAGLMPIPGGIGVAEGALTFGLTSAGVDSATAFAVAITYRMCTFYVPPVWGGVAFHRLERNGYL
ncbi:MAG: lysylphosphatidylglycerol synthase transmembrane domain-containing protein [Acidimicrobiales bacterium]